MQQKYVNKHFGIILMLRTVRHNMGIHEKQ